MKIRKRNCFFRHARRGLILLKNLHAVILQQVVVFGQAGRNCLVGGSKNQICCVYLEDGTDAMVAGIGTKYQSLVVK